MSAEIFKFPGKRRNRRPILTEEEYDALPDLVKAELTAYVDEQKAASRPLRQARRGSGVNINTPCFRSRELILESSEADLVRDAGRDPDKAQVKLEAIRRHLQSVKEESAAEIEALTAADTKLSAAIVAALLSGARSST
jgi:hypothetical protein